MGPEKEIKHVSLEDLINRWKSEGLLKEQPILQEVVDLLEDANKEGLNGKGEVHTLSGVEPDQTTYLLEWEGSQTKKPGSGPGMMVPKLIFAPFHLRVFSKNDADQSYFSISANYFGNDESEEEVGRTEHQSPDELRSIITSQIPRIQESTQR